MKKFKIEQLDKYYDPLNVYRIFKDEEDSAFLDSSKEDSIYSQYSFIGINPIWKFKSYQNVCYINERKIIGVNPFDKLEELINENKIETESSIPFVGGAIGYFSYDIGRTLEKLPETAEEDIKFEDSIFILYENIIIFDLKEKKMYISALSDKAEESIALVKEKLRNYKYIEKIGFEEKNTEFYTNLNKKDFEERVEKLREYIRSGDVYIANMTRRICCHNDDDSFQVYEKLRSINEAPFSAFLNYKDFQVVSSSPERFLNVIDGRVTTRPIKGTRPRGKTLKEDLKNRKELENSEKDKSELLMIVDLERNDLSRVCSPETVKVTELFKIEEYATVFHLVSTIEGQLKKEFSSVKCMKACFPGGSITGAPKIRAMEVIEELEGLRRNIYTGSIGYFDLRGNCDFNIVIRTIIKKGDKAYFGAGGGITWESEKTAEWYETCDKAKALMKVL